MISVIIPLYNHATALRESLKSLAAQTERDLEVIIVDDGSTDNWRAVLDNAQKTFLPKDWEIKIVEQKHTGAAMARNHGFGESTGEYVIFWDADTVADSRMLATLKHALLSSHHSAYAYCDYRFGWKKIPGQIFNPVALKKNNYIDTTALIRREDFIGFDPTLSRFQDWDLWLSMLAKNKTGIYVPGVLYRKLTLSRQGISRWRPKFFLHLPFLKSTREYNRAKQIILQKHRLV